MAKTRAMENKEIRVEAKRQQLANNGHITQVLANIEEIEKLDFFVKGDNEDVDYKLCQANKFRMDALKTSNEQRFKLINKYMPDLKAVAPTVDFDFPKEAKPHEQAVSVMAAIAGGLIPTDIGCAFINSIKHMIDIEEHTDLKERIEAIEQSLSISSD